MGKHEWKGNLALINNLIFFVLYTLLRAILFPMLMYADYKLTYFYKFETSHFISWWIIFILFVCIYFLNIFWYRIIVKGLIA